MLPVLLRFTVPFLIANIIQALQTPSAAFGTAKQYVVMCGWGILFICGYNAVSAVLHGYGDSRRPMYFVALACALNIAGALFMLGGAAPVVSVITILYTIPFVVRQFRLDLRPAQAHGV